MDLFTVGEKVRVRVAVLHDAERDVARYEGHVGIVGYQGKLGRYVTVYWPSRAVSSTWAISDLERVEDVAPERRAVKRERRV